VLARRRILNPEPGSALARAREYGIDLTLIARNISLTPEERLKNAVRSQAMARTLAEIRANTERR
jgi:hypothetical protein